MPQWDHYPVYCYQISIRKEIDGPIPDLDPNFEWTDGNYSVMKIDNLVRPIWEGIQYMGDCGWELVGTTPQLFSPGYSGGSTTFYVLFKRPRTQKEPKEN